MNKSIYNPTVQEPFYHGHIYHEALLTYEQHLEKKHGENMRTADPDDNTNWGALDWYKNGSMSFAEKEWSNFISHLRDCFKVHCGMGFYLKEDCTQYFYHSGSVPGLKGTFLLRSHIYIQHLAGVGMDEERFMNDLTKIGRW
ncbi:hypothetical protein BSK66_31645 [Paenibacillus odorifer]|uniref:hypothetical protein n=1 Tax=Paenibacillus TaxID=44249 RepID=UPI0003E26A00|nr:MULTISPECIES: hypothetical protein [Paenibacillus]ETT46225.1 hypothetical protein C171_28257 [Paenibacillus sp. FSL H8-237]OME46647.1 hypothetical protein BSK66_31645 [Paenibacillus odorifer]